MTYIVCPNWQDQTVFSAEGPQPKVLEENDRFKVILAGLEPRKCLANGWGQL